MTRRFAGTVVAVLALALTSGAAAPSTSTTVSTTIGHGGAPVEIRRTAYGIPHILAHDYAGLGYGYGFAFAQDNLCALADQVVTLRAQRSRFFGATAGSPDGFVRGVTNLDSDTYFQALQRAGTVPALLARPAPLGPTEQLRRLVDGYVEGYNRYLRDTGVAHLPDPTCRNQPWVGPITALDIWTGINEVNRQSGAAALKEAIATATPPAAGTAAAAGTATSTVPALPASAIGSNGWALGRDVTRDHDGMVLANPHLPWSGDARLYQVQLTIPGVLDVSGASFYGSPVVEIGHTRGVAWTHTATHAQHASFYRLSLVPGDPTSYLFDGQAVPMTRQTVPVTTRGADGTLSTVTRTLYSTRYGPVLATGWTATTAFAVRDANADNVRSTNEWLAMDLAQNVAQLRTAQDTYQGMPWVYTMATDATGGVYFADTSVVPHLSDAQATHCVLQADPERPDIVDGSTSACDWGSDPAAIEPGLFGPAHDPELTRTDFVANSNNSPLFTNPAAPLTGYPGVFDSRVQLELRPRASLRMIADGAPRFTLPSLQAAMLGNRNYSAEFGRADVVHMCTAHPVLTARDGTTVDVRAACGALARWDAHDNPDSHGAVLWGAFFGHLSDLPDTWWRVPYDPAHPIDTPRGINGDDDGVRQALADTAQMFTALHLDLDASPGDTMRWEGIPLHGCDEDQGCFNVLDASPTSGGNGDPAEGSTFIMAVEMTSHGPVTRTILAYSESADPTSAHHTDQTVLFSHRQWVTERFTEDEIRTDPQLRTVRLNG